MQVANTYDVGDLFDGRNNGIVPRFGTFGDSGEFLFHGIGCTIDDGTVTVNFDFLPDGSSNGFDAWRLHTFAEDNQVDDLGLDTSPHQLERALARLVESGRALRVPNSRLIVLKSVDGEA